MAAQLSSLPRCIVLLASLHLADAFPTLRMQRISEESGSSGASETKVLPVSLAGLSGRKAVEISKNGEVKPKSAGWFGDFSQMESTYDVAGEDAYTGDNPARLVKHGVDMGFSSPYGPSSVMKADWFHESPSAGARAAWQSHYPSLKYTAGNREVSDNHWRDTPEGWYQDYSPSYWGINERSKGTKAADWFDSSVNNIGAFGRQMVPDSDDPRILEADVVPWVERSVNSTISCAAVGCTAYVTLVPYDAAVEEATNCRLSAKVHPTDFDNAYSDEFSNSWQVNGYLFRDRCDPMASGCTTETARPLYNCVEGLSVDHLIDPAVGQLNVQATLNEMVDECPYNGNLLDGVVYATCMVRTTTTTTTTTTTSMSEEEEMLLYGYGASGHLRCKDPGCTATMEMYIDPTLVYFGGSCKMNVTVLQTDYDGGQDVIEEVEYIWLNSAGNISEHVSPGLNPCLAEQQGTPLTDEEMNFTLVDSLDVTDEVLFEPIGKLEVAGKISLHVDECATKGGYLFDAWVSVFCDPPPQ